MKKKILSVLASSAIIGSMVCVSAVNTSAFSGQITFEIPDRWLDYNNALYVHIWNGLPGGEGLYGWQTEDEKMTISEDKKTATYEVPEGDWNLIIISGDDGIQTYDSVFNANCIGDTCYAVEFMPHSGPVDSYRGSYSLAWRNNPDCGAHKIVSPIGQVIGKSFLPGETNQTLFDDFVKKYNPQNSVDGLVDGEYYFDWNDDGATVTGMSWDEAKSRVASELGVTEQPTEDPTEVPTEAPTAEATEVPTEAPTAEATVAPTEAPTDKATEAPTAAPTVAPTTAPTQAPTKAPSSNASKGAVNTSQGSTIAVIASALLATLGVVYAVGKKRAKNN